MTSSTAPPLDPYRCIAKKNRKYASECTEVHLAKLGAESVSENFAHFGNLEVVWFNGNRLSRIENLENNFRIREVYIQDNRLVSLAGLKTFKFLRVLLASGNQLRNLDKQLSLLSRFAFLKKLDLFDNPVAEEPDYRLRLIYHVPQVEILDQHSVKGPERIKADEVVPNLDKVTAAKAEKPKATVDELSYNERSCIIAAKKIKEKQRKEEEALLGQTFSEGIAKDTLPPNSRIFHTNREHWSEPRLVGRDGGTLDPRKKVEHERVRPTAWERHEMRSLIEKRADKAQLTRQDVEALAEDLATGGLEEVGRALKSSRIFDRSMWQDATSMNATSLARSLKTHSAKNGEALEDPHPLESLLQDESATIAVGELASYLLTLEWPRHDDDHLDMRIAKHYEDAQRAEFAGDMAAVAKHSQAAARLEGAKTLKQHVELNRKDTGQALQKARTDFFPQSFLRPQRQVDDATGRVVLKVLKDGRSTSMGTMTIGKKGSGYAA